MTESNRLLDANMLFQAGDAAVKSSAFKHTTQQFHLGLMGEIAELQEDLRNKTYRPSAGIKFVIRERGKTRFITSNVIRDKVVNHILCDLILMPAITPLLIYDNGASQKGKGVSFHRKRIEIHLRQYYRRYRTNGGYALLVDFSGYYGNILHRHCRAILDDALERYRSKGLCIDEEVETARWILDMIFETFRVDVSRFSDEDIEKMYTTKVEPMINYGVPKSQLTGEKFLDKGVDIGNQVSQGIGLVYAYSIDNYVKIVRGEKFYGRYTDDLYIFHPDKKHLQDVLEGIKKAADECGILINPKKTRIVKLSKPFRHLQLSYQLTETGKVKVRINPQSIVRERRRIKKYRGLVDAGIMTEEMAENAFKSWIGSFVDYMSNKQVINLGVEYYSLFNGRQLAWQKRGMSRLRWLMGLSWKALRSTEITSYPAQKSTRQSLTAI